MRLHRCCCVCTAVGAFAPHPILLSQARRGGASASSARTSISDKANNRLARRMMALCRSVAAAPRAASLGARLRQAAEEFSSQRVLHGQLLLRCFTSDSSGSNINQPFAPSGSAIAGDLKPHQNLNSTNFVRHDIHARAQAGFINTDNGAAMFRTAGGEKPSHFRPFAASRLFRDHEQNSQMKKRDFVHVLLKKKKTFVTVTDASGNKKTGASAGSLEDRKGRSRLSRYASEAVAEQVGRSARKMGLRSVVMKVKGAAFFKKKKKVILSFREGFRGERVRDQSPIMYIHDVTQLPHNGCRLPKQRRV
ncbi:hypothetical protein U9M48_044797 [Paspalum notatum var. saurae]|uniref:Ribosomal protein S11 n=1 Tax=Paspalum notatum var. saurae TaxID=547442 RepID=A0AAQ3V0H1_PASNO